MARPKKYKIKLTDDELKELKSVIRKNKTSKTIRCRCQIIIDLDESHGKVLTHEQSAKSNGVCLATVTNTVKKYFEGGIDAVTEFKRNVNSDNARRVLDGRAEARIIELACGPVPEGHSRWTILLLEEKAKIVLDTPVSREAIRRTLKKQTSTSQKRLLVHHLKRRCRICSLYGRCPWEMQKNHYQCVLEIMPKLIPNTYAMEHAVYLRLLNHLMGCIM